MMSSDPPLSWFKVQIALLSHPKFTSLSRVQCGDLLKCWLVAYNNPYIRGLIGDSDLIRVADAIGGDVRGHPSRAKSILDEFVRIRFFDYVNTGYVIHDMDDWQPSSLHSRERVRKSRIRTFSEGLSAEVSAEVSAEDAPGESTELSSLPTQSNQSLIANCNTPIPVTVPVEQIRADISSASHYPEAQKVLSGMIIRQQKPKKMKKEGDSDSRYLPLRKSITDEWLTHRGIPITQCCTKADWVHLARILQALPDITLQSLRDSYLRFLADTSPFMLQQRPIAYWATHLQAFIGSNGNQASVQVIADTEVRSMCPMHKCYDTCHYPGSVRERVGETTADGGRNAVPSGAREQVASSPPDGWEDF